MTPSIRNMAFFALTTLAFGSGAEAQSDDDLRQAFSGTWYVFDQGFSSQNQPCRVILENVGTPSDGGTAAGFKAAAENCSGPLGQGITWRVESGKILLTLTSGQVIAALGGNPQRLSGDYAGPPGAVVLERENGSGAKAELTAAIKGHGCYYLGYTADCADKSATKSPRFNAGTAEIDVLVKLNVRNQPRRDAPVIGTIPRGSTVTINACLTTSDGIWCRAWFDSSMGWMAKSALRQGQWPVITYVNAGAKEES